MSLEAYTGTSTSAVTCPAQVLGMSLVPYGGRLWSTMNGAYVAVGRTLTATRYRANSGQVSVFGDFENGARAVADSWEVTCFQVGPNAIAYIDPRSFRPSNWRITYDPNRSGDGGGGGGGECDYQIIYDPSTCSPDDGGGGSGGVYDPPNDSPGVPGGSSSLCYTLYLDPGCYDVFVDGFYDSTICC
jgi:hypothetical protein